MTHPIGIEPYNATTIGRQSCGNRHHLLRAIRNAKLKRSADVDALPHPEVRRVTKATAKQQMLKQLICTDAPEQALRYHGFRSIAGVDEVGRGALFGPVVAAAVILPDKSPPSPAPASKTPSR